MQVSVTMPFTKPAFACFFSCELERPHLSRSETVSHRRRGSGPSVRTRWVTTNLRLATKPLHLKPFQPRVHTVTTVTGGEFARRATIAAQVNARFYFPRIHRPALLGFAYLASRQLQHQIIQPLHEPRRVVELPALLHAGDVVSQRDFLLTRKGSGYILLGAGARRELVAPLVH